MTKQITSKEELRVLFKETLSRAVCMKDEGVLKSISVAEAKRLYRLCSGVDYPRKSAKKADILYSIKNYFDDEIRTAAIAQKIR